MTGAISGDVFAQALADLKRRGCNLLVVGHGGDGGHDTACGRMLGAADAVRERLLVLTEGDDDIDERLSGVDPDTVHVLDGANLTRSAAERRATPVPPRTTAVPSGNVDELRAAVATEIQAYDDLAPAELRVCVDSLRPLLEAGDTAAVTAFLQSVTGEVVSVRGMGHYHLPVPMDDPVVSELAPLFDAVVELGHGPDGHRQRWHLAEPDGATDWLDLQGI